MLLPASHREAEAQRAAPERRLRSKSRRKYHSAPHPDRAPVRGGRRECGAGGELPIKFYDSEGQYPIPMGPWMHGDLPEQGKPHLKIVVTGEKFPTPVDPETGESYVFDRSMTLYEAHNNRAAGTHPIADPRRDLQKVYGLDVCSRCSGHNPLMQLRFHWRIPDKLLGHIYSEAWKLVDRVTHPTPHRTRIVTEDT